jgi:hypothetical protein
MALAIGCFAAWAKRKGTKKTLILMGPGALTLMAYFCLNNPVMVRAAPGGDAG